MHLLEEDLVALAADNALQDQPAICPSDIADQHHSLWVSDAKTLREVRRPMCGTACHNDRLDSSHRVRTSLLPAAPLARHSSLRLVSLAVQTLLPDAARLPGWRCTQVCRREPASCRHDCAIDRPQHCRAPLVPAPQGDGECRACCISAAQADSSARVLG